MVKKVLRSAEKFSQPFPLSPLPLYPSPKQSAIANAFWKPLTVGRTSQLSGITAGFLVAVTDFAMEFLVQDDGFCDGFFLVFS